MAAYAMWFAALWAFCFFDMVELRPTAVLTAIVAATHVLMYAALRRGWLARLEGVGPAEPGAGAFTRLVVGLTVLWLTVWLIPTASQVAPQWLMVVVAVDVYRLSTPQRTFALALLAVGLLSQAVRLEPWTGPHQRLGIEIVRLVTALSCLGVLGVMSYLARAIHAEQGCQHAALAEALERQKQLSEEDVLTGAANRRHGQVLLQTDVARQSRSGEPSTLAMLDIDHFKRINDVFGHACGDTVLKTLVQLARQVLRGNDVVVRWGGEEFLVLLPHTTQANAAEVLRRLRDRVRSHPWHDIADGLAVDFSCGVCQHSPGTAIERTVAAADAALYAAKAQGRGRVAEHHG